MLQGSGEPLAEGGGEANAEALLPFAAVLSGTLSLLTPDPENPEAGAAQRPVPEEDTGEIEVSEALLQHLGRVEIDPSDVTGHSSEPETSSTLLPAGDEGFAGSRPGNMPTLDAAQQAAPLDAAQQPVADDASLPAPAMPEAEGPSAEPPAEILRHSLDGDDQTGSQPLDIAQEEGGEGADVSEKTAGRRQTARVITSTESGKTTAPVARNAGQVAHAVIAETKEPPAPAMTTPEAARTAPEVDAALPDIEGTTPEKTTETTVSSREKATATDIDGGDVSADAGGDSDTPKEGTRRSRRVRRAEAEPAALHKIEQSAVEQARSQETAPPQTDITLEPTPEPADTENAALPDLDPSLAPAEEHVAPSASEKSTAEAPVGRTRAARGLFQQNRAVPVAWLRAVLNNARQAVFSEDGWKVLEMNLDEGDGTVTIKARREEGRVAVAVGFSDPELRALASTHAERLQEVLQAEYETAVDFSLFSGNTDDSGGQHQSEGARGAVAPTAHADADADIHDGYPTRRSLPAGARNEWVG